MIVQEALKRVYSPRFISLLTNAEYLMLTSYKDTDGTWHVAYGHGNINGIPPFVDENTVIKDADEAMSILLLELDTIYVPQLDSYLKKNNITDLKDHEYEAFLDIGYNRGMGTMSRSYAFECLKTPKPKDKHKTDAALAIVNSHVDGYAPLDVAQDRKDPTIIRVYDGLQKRRIADSALFTNW